MSRLYFVEEVERCRHHRFIISFCSHCLICSSYIDYYSPRSTKLILEQNYFVCSRL